MIFLANSHLSTLIVSYLQQTKVSITMKEEQWMSELNVTVQHLGQVIGYTMTWSVVLE